MSGLFVLAALAVAAEPSMEGGRTPPEVKAPDLSFDKAEVMGLIEGWNHESRTAARALIDKYGAPDGVTPDMLVWMGDGKWHETVVSNDAVQQNFPTPHKNVVTQWVAYKMPVDKIDDVARFNGSVVYDRTRGMVGVSGPDEATNILTLNVMDDIVAGRREVEAARQFYADTARSYTAATHNEYVDGFRFEVPSRAADPDEAVKQSRPGRVGS